MSLMKIHDIYIRNLEGKIPPDEVIRYMPKNVVIERLHAITGLNFGDDVQLWVDWIYLRQDEFHLLHRQYQKNQNA